MGASNPRENVSYCWVVICKNTKAHKNENMMIGHKIPLAETDASSPCLSAGLSLSSATNAVKKTRMSRVKF
jgi:hypothetical protein